jgi:hypothetical protein
MVSFKGFRNSVIAGMLAGCVWASYEGNYNKAVEESRGALNEVVTRLEEQRMQTTGNPGPKVNVGKTWFDHKNSQNQFTDIGSYTVYKDALTQYMDYSAQLKFSPKKIVYGGAIGGGAYLTFLGVSAGLGVAKKYLKKKKVAGADNIRPSEPMPKSVFRRTLDWVKNAPTRMKDAYSSRQERLAQIERQRLEEREYAFRGGRTVADDLEVQRAVERELNRKGAVKKTLSRVAKRAAIGALGGALASGYVEMAGQAKHNGLKDSLIQNQSNVVDTRSAKDKFYGVGKPPAPAKVTNSQILKNSIRHLSPLPRMPGKKMLGFGMVGGGALGMAGAGLLKRRRR